MGSRAPCAARETFDWCVRVLDLLTARPNLDVAVLVNDRVDVAAALRLEAATASTSARTIAIHGSLGRSSARMPGIGISTHDASQVGATWDLPSTTSDSDPSTPADEGLREGAGRRAAWVAAEGAGRAVFPIGGIDATNIGDLSRIGRACVGSAILAAEDPSTAARELRDLLCG
jgi:thiamine monophosphate synthase